MLKKTISAYVLLGFLMPYCSIAQETKLPFEGDYIIAERHKVCINEGSDKNIVYVGQNSISGKEFSFNWQVLEVDPRTWLLHIRVTPPGKPEQELKGKIELTSDRRQTKLSIWSERTNEMSNFTLMRCGNSGPLPAELLAQLANVFGFYRLAEVCASKGAVFSPDEVDRFQVAIKQQVDKQGIAQPDKDRAWQAAEAGLQASGVNGLRQKALESECLGLRNTLAHGYPTIFHSESQRKNPF